MQQEELVWFEWKDLLGLLRNGELIKPNHKLPECCKIRLRLTIHIPRTLFSFKEKFAQLTRSQKALIVRWLQTHTKQKLSTKSRI